MRGPALASHFVVLSVTRPAWRIEPGSEHLLAPGVGLLAGTLGGITNAPSVALTPYYYALGLPKAEFVRAISATFLVFKLAQLGAVWQVGLIDRRVLLPWHAATLVSFGAFRLGLSVQDRVPQATFTRAVLLPLSVTAIAVPARGLRS